MKKTLLILAALMIVCLASCGSNNGNTTTQPPETTLESTTEAKQEDVVIKIDKDTLTDAESFKNEMESYGAKTKDLSEDNSFEFTFLKADHDKLIKDKFDATVNEFKKYEDNQEHYIDKIEYDADFRNLKFKVNKDLYSANSDTTSDIIIAAAALSYQNYLEEGQRTNVEVIYSDTEEVVETFALPMSFSIE